MSDAPIFQAVLDQDLNGLKSLLENGEDPNTEDLQKGTPLHLAVQQNSNKEIVELLLKHGAKVNAEDTFGATPLLEAVRIIEQYFRYYKVFSRKRCLCQCPRQKWSHSSSHNHLQKQKKRFPNTKISA